jgi:hypothetical protein
MYRRYIRILISERSVESKARRSEDRFVRHLVILGGERKENAMFPICIMTNAMNVRCRLLCYLLEWVDDHPGLDGSEGEYSGTQINKKVTNLFDNSG